MKDHLFTDVSKTLVEDFDSTTPSECDHSPSEFFRASHVSEQPVAKVSPFLHLFKCSCQFCGLECWSTHKALLDAPFSFGLCECSLIHSGMESMATLK